MRILNLALIALLFPATALAEGRQFAKGETVALQPDEAYILVRTFARPGDGLLGTIRFAPLLIRVVGDAELQNAQALAASGASNWQNKVEPNVVAPKPGIFFDENGIEDFQLVAVKPGTYVLGSILHANGVMIVSLCMGTVKFEAKPGVITDLGTIFDVWDNTPTDIPELAKVVLGHPVKDGLISEVVGIRPPGPQPEGPAALSALPRVDADYRAVAPYPNYLGAIIARLAPVTGVLDYDKDGNVIDLKASH